MCNVNDRSEMSESMRVVRDRVEALGASDSSLAARLDPILKALLHWMKEVDGVVAKLDRDFELKKKQELVKSASEKLTPQELAALRGTA